MTTEFGVGELTPERLTVLLLNEVSRKSHDELITPPKLPKVKRIRSKKAPAANVDSASERAAGASEDVDKSLKNPVKKMATKSSVKKPRDPSDYNKFVREYCATHKGTFKTSVEELKDLTEDKMTPEQLKVYKAEKMMYRKQVFSKELGSAWSDYKKQHKERSKRVTNFVDFCQLYPEDEEAKKAWYAEGPGIAYPRLVISMFPIVGKYCTDAIVKLLAGDTKGAQAVQETHDNSRLTEIAENSDTSSIVGSPGIDNGDGVVPALKSTTTEVPVAVVNSRGEEKMLGKANLIIMLAAQQWGRILTSFYAKYPKCGKYEKGIPCYTISASNESIQDTPNAMKLVVSVNN